MKIRTKNKQLARVRKRNALAQTLRRELLSPRNIGGQTRQLTVEAAHRLPSGPRQPMRRRPGNSELSQPAFLFRPADVSTQSREPSGKVPAAHRNPPRALFGERKVPQSISGTPTRRIMRPRAPIVTYGAAAIADGTRIVRIDASVDIASVREEDRFGVDAMGQSATFKVISVGFRPHCIELDRPLPRGRYGWSILAG